MDRRFSSIRGRPASAPLELRRRHRAVVLGIAVHRELRQLRAAYRLLQGSKLNTSDALAAMRRSLATQPAEHVQYLVEFVEASERGVIK